MDLYNKVALITGGARIGVTVAEELGRKGCHVALVYRNSREQAELAAKKVESFGSNTFVVKGDVTKKADAARIVRQTVKDLGGIDILINMASIYFETELGELDEDSWIRNLDANLKSAFLMSMEAIPYLSKTSGRIINFSDWLAASGRPRYKKYVPYYSAKAGVLGLTQSLALELAPKILVNAIAPGPILAPAKSSKKEREAVKVETPLQRWGGALEIAKAVIFLIETDFVTGECVRVDGGRHLR